MAQALRLAARGMETCRPNPRVGCVIAQDQEVVGRGWHERAGQEHAEIAALAEADGRARGATAYVTLEPCAMCAGAIIHARLGRIVFGARDPKAGAVDSVVHLLEPGLFNHDVSWTGGVMEDECAELLTTFFRERRGRRTP